MLDGKAVVVGHEKLGGIFTEQGIPGVGIVCRDACVFFHGRGDGGEVGFLRFLAVVPLCAEKADFIFHLYHDHGIFFAVCFPKVGHEAGECAGVGFYGGGAERGYGIGGVVGAVACTEVGYRILFYPGGGIHGFAILPDTEPQEYQLLPFLSGLEEKAVCETEVKGAFFRFQRLPADRGNDGIQGKGTQGGPYIFLHVVGGGTAGIMELASQDQERLIVYI